MKHSVWGFTLLEVVVALAVVSLALGGALSIASSSARSARHLERTITAHWVARNVIATLRLAEPDARAIPGTFEETMLGYGFAATTRIEPIRDGLTAVSVSVSNGDDELVAYNAWIYDD